MGIKNARMRDAVTTDSLESRLEAKLREDAGDQDDWTKLLNAVAQRYGKEKARVIHDYVQYGTDSGPELMKDYGLTPGDGMEENQREWFKKFPWLEKLDKTSWMDRLINIAGEGPEYGGAGYEYPKGLESAVPEDEHISPEIKSQGMRDFLDVIIDKDEPNVYDQMDDSAKILYKYNSMTGNKLSREQIDMLTDLRQKDDVEFQKQLTKMIHFE